MVSFCFLSRQARETVGGNGVPWLRFSLNPRPFHAVDTIILAARANNTLIHWVLAKYTGLIVVSFLRLLFSFLPKSDTPISLLRRLFFVFLQYIQLTNNLVQLMEGPSGHRAERPACGLGLRPARSSGGDRLGREASQTAEQKAVLGCVFVRAPSTIFMLQPFEAWCFFHQK